MPTEPTPDRRLRIYLAGPEVFLPEAAALADRKRRICDEHGFDASFPLDQVPDLHEAAPPAETARRIFAICLAMMDTCDLVVANVTPFRGVGVDAGTAVEIGYMAASGKPVFAYSTVAADYRERVEESGAAGPSELVEDYGLADNLMVEGVARWAGTGDAGIVRVEAPPGERWTHMEAFTRCLRLARDHDRHRRPEGPVRHTG